MNSSEIQKEMEEQIARVMARHGTNSDDFLYHMLCLVNEWYVKGMKLGITADPRVLSQKLS